MSDNEASDDDEFSQLLEAELADTASQSSGAENGIPASPQM